MMDRADLISRFPDSGNFLTFLEENLLPNRPCVFGESFTRGWKARQEWRNVGDTPNIDFLEEHFGHVVVPVADCSCVEFSTHRKTEMTLKEYAHWWRSKGKSRTLYLKDWHFTKDFPNYKAYTVPDFFKSDWLNEVWSARLDVSDDYRFVYIGPKGTWTPFHADVFRSYSWSANVCGCKEWLLFPPGEEELLKDKFGHLPFDVTSRELENKELYPNVHKSRGPIRVVQRSGEIIFVPSGWHHQVRNTEDTLSINHNWTNSCGIGYMWSHLQNELVLVKRELEDCRSMDSWEEQCQLSIGCAEGECWDGLLGVCATALYCCSVKAESTQRNSHPNLETVRRLLLTAHTNSRDVIQSIESYHISRIYL
ncbi:2-oxoglutarate and iron-dependent oxygenase JMJD4-like isoform X2 [Halichondria panicea]|uniref:2-oxoglutarate and iron-dependent oxygenase JMJD4-like isoform X2 n=1 Tax=Halichondria panicea TaxID=6063 RepID=UPI00312BC74A